MKIRIIYLTEQLGIPDLERTELLLQAWGSDDVTISRYLTGFAMNSASIEVHANEEYVLDDVLSVYPSLRKIIFEVRGEWKNIDNVLDDIKASVGFKYNETAAKQITDYLKAINHES